MIRFMLSLCIFIIGTFCLAASDISVDGEPLSLKTRNITASPRGTGNSKYLNGIEIDIVRMKDKGIVFDYTRSLWRYGDVYLGFTHEKKSNYYDRGNLRFYGGQFGYRQFIWPVLFFAAELDALRYTVKQDSDNATYRGYQMFFVPSIGSRVDIEVFGGNFYLMPVITLPLNLYTANKWPEYSNDINTKAYLFIGFRF